MAKIKWEGAATSRGNVLTTELNSLGSGSYSAVGTAIVNSTNRDIWCGFKIDLASFTPTTNGYVQIFLVQALDDTNYEDAPGSTNPGSHMALRQLALLISTSAKRVYQPMVRLPPGTWKIVLLNGSGAALASSGNTVAAYTANEEIA